MLPFEIAAKTTTASFRLLATIVFIIFFIIRWITTNCFINSFNAAHLLFSVVFVGAFLVATFVIVLIIVIHISPF